MVYPYILQLPRYGELHCDEIQVKRHENGQVALIAVTDEQEHLVVTKPLNGWTFKHYHVFVPDFGEQEGMPRALALARVAIAREAVGLPEGRGQVMEIIDTDIRMQIAMLPSLRMHRAR